MDVTPLPSLKVNQDLLTDLLLELRQLQSKSTDEKRLFGKGKLIKQVIDDNCHIILKFLLDNFDDLRDYVTYEDIVECMKISLRRYHIAKSLFRVTESVVQVHLQISDWMDRRNPGDRQ